MSNFDSSLKLAAVLGACCYLTACGSDNDIISCGEGEGQNADGSACVVLPPPPPLVCDAPLVPNDAGTECVPDSSAGEAPEPVVTAGENEAVLFYNRPDGAYDGWVLHLWNDDNCPDTVVNETTWPEGPSIDGVDPNYGGYYIIPLLEGFSSCMNFIVHDPDGNKDLSENDRRLTLTGDRMGWTLSGVPDVFLQPLFIDDSEGPVVVIDGAGLHWVTESEFVWNIDMSNVSSVRLYYSDAAEISLAPGEGFGDTPFVELAFADSLADASVIPPTQEGWQVLTTDMSTDDVKAMLKRQLVAATVDANGDVTSATRLQTASVLDDVYTSGENDADEAPLGLVYTDNGIMSYLWAPTAQSVELKLYNASKEEQATVAMTEDTTSGVWSAQVDSAMDRMFYRFDITVYHPVTDTLEQLEVTDPYSVSLSTNGRFSQLVNLADDDLKPEGWDSHDIPTVEYPEDSSIYEGHVRDFSALDESTSAANRGKYMAFTEKDSAPMQHLATLQQAGLTHFHVLPANDIASVDEDISTRVNVTNTVADLCAVVSDAPVCGVEDDSATLLSVLQSYDPATDQAQTLVASMKGLDSFNWGYDPHHYNAPEGSYSSDPDGVARIIEMRAMNQALHEIGLRVIMDNVYNHTNASGVSINSVLDKVVPGYYHRYNQDSGSIERSTCCDNTATENRMMEKLMVDSMVVWSEQYKFDGFRFDLMGHIPREGVLKAREAVQAVDADTYFYGEGWDFGEVAGDRLFVQARQDNMAGTEVGTFNDRIREAVRGGALFSGETNDGVLNVMDTIKVGMAGTLEDYVFVDRNDNQSTGGSQGGYASDPADIINYVSVHDNETLFDQFNFVLPTDISVENRVRAQNVALSIPMFSQGIPFFHMGADLLRSKSMDRNTFDSGDWFNFIDFTKQTNNFNVGEPLISENGEKIDAIRDVINDAANRTPSAVDIEFATSVFQEFLSIRSDSRLFRLTTAEDISARVGFHTVGRNQVGGVVVMSIDDGIGLTDLDPASDAIVVMVNGTSEEQSHTVSTATGFSLHPTLMSSVDASVQSASFAEGDGEGTFTVPAYTTAVFVKTQGAAQGEGLSAFVTTGAPDVAPFGDTVVYLRGSMDDWADPPASSQAFNYDGSGVYSFAIELTAETEYMFKVASADWSAVNFGAEEGGDPVVVAGEPKTLFTSNTNLSFTPTADATYVFSFDANDIAAPVLTVVNEEPYQGETIYLRGSMNDWADPPTQAFTYDGEGYYFTQVNLAAGEYAFKVADAAWGEVNLGSDGTTLNVGEEVTMVPGGNDNIPLNVDADGDYVFTVNANDLAAPTVSIFAAGMYGDLELFVRGNHNSWGAETPMDFDGSFTYSQEIDLIAGELVFKVADADWNTVNKGASSEGNIVTLGKRLKLETNSGGDLTLEVPNNGIYVFELKGPDTEFPTVTVSAKE